VIVEAYRHLVDPFEGITGDMVRPRRLLTVEVDASEVLDLRTPRSLATVGLHEEDLRSPIGEARPVHPVALAGSGTRRMSQVMLTAGPPRGPACGI